MSGGSAPTAAPAREPPAPARTPVPEQNPATGTDPAAPGNAALFGLLANGDFVVNLGPPPGLTIPKALLEAKKIDLKDRGRVLPGLAFDDAKFVRGDPDKMLRISGHFEIPQVEPGGFQVDVSREGKASLSAKAKTTLPALGNPELSVSIDESRNLAAKVTITAADLTPASLGKRLKVIGGGEVNLVAGKLWGNVEAALEYPSLGKGDFKLAFSEAGKLSGSGHIELTAPFLAGVKADLAVDERGALTGAVEVPAAQIVPPAAGLKIESGIVKLAYKDGTPSGALEALMLSYPGLGSAAVTASIANGRIEGDGAFNLALSGFADVAGTWAFVDGNLSGGVKINSKDFPEGLPVKAGSIEAKLGPTGAVSFSGAVAVTLGPAGSGELRAAYNEAGQLSIGATVNLTVPGLQGAAFTINYVEGKLEGSGEVPIDPTLLPGISGNLSVEYRQGLWAGETELSYVADNGKLSGTVRIRVAQTEEGALQVTGGGDVTAQIAPRISGTLHAEILPEGGVDVSGKISVTEPVELFPEFRTDKELFRYSQNIPLWAILVAVIRVRAGVRAGVGPGVFRNITVEGSYTVGKEGEPSFSISGEMFIPAFAEAYVAFGAGLGLDVVLGSLTGGIEGVASAGVYGAVSVIPVLSYANGDYMIDGTATLAAGARFKVGLNAWAEIEACWVTVWEESWKLGEWMWNIGPDLGLQAKMSYNFSNPAPPTIELNTTDIDTESLIKAAMPEDGPAPSGAKEALQNKADWKGQLKAPGPEAGAVPPELAQQAGAGTPAPPAPPKPPGKPKPPGLVAPAAAPTVASPGEAAAAPNKGAAPPGTTPGASPDAAANAAGPAPGRPASPNSADAASIRDAATKPATPESPLPPGQAPPTTEARFPQALSMATLDEPPVPMPRTPEQQQQDVCKAAEMVGLVEADIEDTSQLESYFPRIKRRFQLSAIHLDAQGTGACVTCEINPTAVNPIVELLRGDSLAQPESLALKTAIDYTSSKLAGDDVGVVMEAKLLGPDHPAGSGPSGQAGLMSKLGSRTGSETENYFRGHLLNDNIGGPGKPYNLFPITQQANRQHEQYVEHHIKKWVNQDRYWCYYKVVIANEKDNFNDTSATAHWVSADIVTTAAVLRVGNKLDASKSDVAVTIRSQSSMATVPAPPGAAGAAAVNLNTTSQTPEKGVTVDTMNTTGVIGFTDPNNVQPVALSTRNREGTKALDPDLARATLDAIARAKGDSALVERKVDEVAGIGPATASLLVALALNPAKFATLGPSQVGLVTELNNEPFKAAVLARLALP
ncbi:MAG TPA: hypothetical protein VF645_08745 [Allosphingosinicella sp.]|jgi:hypothetical protein